MTELSSAEIASAERLGARGQRILITLVGTLLGALPPIFFTLTSQVVSVPGDAAAVTPITIWPLEGLKVAVGMLAGPVAGLVAGLGSQILTLALLRHDLLGTWTWIVAGGLAGLLGGLIPRWFPGPWQVHGPRRLATASIVGVVALILPFLLTLLDPVLRPGVSQPVAIGQLLSNLVPNALLAGIVVPLVVYGVGAAGIDAHADLPPGERLPRPSPGWRPFAVGLGVAVALLFGLSFVGSSNVRLVGAESAAVPPAAPAAAPGPADAAAPARLAELAIPASPDQSCENEADVRSEATYSMTTVTLQNDSGQELLLAWLDFEGHRAEPDIVGIGERGDGWWGVGHVFLLGRPDGTCLVIFKIVGAGTMTLRLVP
jgi:hypothetical protein